MWEWIKWKLAIGWDLVDEDVERDHRSNGEWGWRTTTWRNRKTGQYRYVRSSYRYIPYF